MTLTRYLTQYLFNPITMALLRNRAARGLPIGRAAQRSGMGFVVTLGLPLCVTMGLAGIWHGAGWTFLVFGLLHAAYLTINHAWRIFGSGWPAGRAGAVLGIGLTYLAVLVGAVFFRAPGITSALHLLAGMAGLHGTGFVIPGEAKAQGKLALNVIWLRLLYAIVWGMPNTQEIMGEVRNRLPALRWRLSLPWAVGFGAAAAVGLLSVGGTGEFLYFQF